MSVGHVARAVEEAGIPTVAIFVKAFRFHAENMKLPRTLVTRHPMSRPMGAAGDQGRHELVLSRALSLLERAQSGGAVEELDLDYRVAPARASG